MTQVSFGRIITVSDMLWMMFLAYMLTSTICTIMFVAWAFVLGAMALEREQRSIKRDAATAEMNKIIIDLNTRAFNELKDDRLIKDLRSFKSIKDNAE